MDDTADVLVVGSGGLGAATAYFLAKRGAGRIALLDRHDIGSQTSPRAAGMVSTLRKSDLMIGLIRQAAAKIRSFTEDTGQPLDWVHSGSLKVARRPEDGEVLEDDLVRGKRYGLDVALIAPEDAKGLNRSCRSGTSWRYCASVMTCTSTRRNWR